MLIEMEEIDTRMKKIIDEELPEIIKKHPKVKYILWEKLVDSFADKQQTESKFEKLLQELKDLKIESEKKWKELKEESEKKWKELKEESEKKWKELKEESERKWEESDRRWQQALQEIKKVNTRIDRTIGALGARWGLNTEKAFRDAIKDILSELTGMKIERYLSYDKKGEVFGQPDQVELDVVMRNGKVYVIEIKSSVSKADMYIFDKKVKFYEKKEDKKVDKKIIISPMIEAKAYDVAKSLGIETYLEPEEVEI